MIVPYASDEEYERSKDEQNLTIIDDKDIKISTSEVSMDNVRNDNLFAFDVINFLILFQATYVKLFKNYSNNQSDDQFLQKFEKLQLKNGELVNVNCKKNH